MIGPVLFLLFFVSVQRLDQPYFAFFFGTSIFTGLVLFFLFLVLYRFSLDWFYFACDFLCLFPMQAVMWEVTTDQRHKTFRVPETKALDRRYT
jgi:hypothetical protein